jgi:hypothetical protein
VVRGARVHDHRRPLDCARRARPGAADLRRRRARRPLPRRARAAESHGFARRPRRGVPQAHADLVAAAGRCEPRAAPLPRERRQRGVPARRRHHRLRPGARRRLRRAREQRLAGRQPAHGQRGRPQPTPRRRRVPERPADRRHRAEERRERERDHLDAFQQLQTYKQELPSLFVFNELLVIRMGSKRASARCRRTRSVSCPGAPSRARRSRPRR